MPIPTNEPVFHPIGVTMDPPAEQQTTEAAVEQQTTEAAVEQTQANEPETSVEAEAEASLPEPASIIEDVEVSDDVAFNFRPGGHEHYIGHPTIPYIGVEHELDKVADGGLFFAGYLHDPAKSVDHYDYQNYRVDLISGKVSRKGLPPKYWRDHALKRPPLMRKAGKGVIFVE